MKSGIYYIKNLVNDKMYVGQTGDFTNRWAHHRNDLKNGKHHNVKLQNAWNKYGEDNFEFGVLEECEPDKLNERETYWIEHYDSLKNGYNLSEGGDGIRGYKHTEEEIQKMIQIQKPRAVLQIDMETLEVLGEFPSASWAAKMLGLSARGIKACCNQENKQHSIGGFFWVYQDEYEDGTLNWEYFTKNYHPNIKRPVKQFDLDGNFIKEWESLYATRKAGFDDAQICEICSKKYKTRHTHMGYYWCYSGDTVTIKNRYIDQYTLDGEYVATYSSMREAEIAVSGAPKGDICKIGKDGRQKSLGFRWKVREETKIVQ